MFRFRFEQLLNYRKLAEEQVMQVFSEKRRDLDLEMSVLQSIRGEKTSVLDTLLRKQSDDFSAPEIGLYFGYLKTLRDREVSQIVRVQDKERELEKKREELVEAMKRRKIMEILKEKKKDAYVKEANQKESIELNEQGIIRYMRSEK